jgi:hypothetical protein
METVIHGRPGHLDWGISGTATAIFIDSTQRLGQPRTDLEDDLDDLREGVEQVTRGGGGEAGWNIDVRLGDATEAEQWVDRLAEFLRESGVPEDT